VNGEAHRGNMPTYWYRGVDGAGRRKAGFVDAASEADVLERLEAEGILPLGVRRRASPLRLEKAMRLLATPLGAVPMRDMAWFCRQFTTLLRAGVPIARTLALMETGAKGNRSLRQMAAEVRRRVEQGQDLATSFAPYARRLPAGFLALLRAGESSGTLDEALERLAELYERADQQQQRVRQSSTYPIVVATVATGLVLFLLAFVVPNFATLYRGLKTPLPGSTRVLFAVSRWLGPHLWLVGLAAAALAAGSAAAFADPRLRPALDRALMRLPVLGRIRRAAVVTRVGYTLSTLLRSGVPVLESVALTADVAGPNEYGGALRAALDRIARGETLARAFGAGSRFPELFVEMVRIGEESGSVDDMLIRVARVYEQEVETLTRQISSLIEPALVVGLGAVVALVIIAILIPMYDVFRLIGTGGGL
jgi:type IV pilus assembly protein PilC